MNPVSQSLRVSSESNLATAAKIRSDAVIEIEKPIMADSEALAHPVKLSETQDIVIIGGGAASAQIVNVMNCTTRGAYSKFSIVTDQSRDGWNPIGRGEGHINQQRELVSHYTNTVPAYNPGYTDRKELFEANTRIIDAAEDKGATRLVKNVESITKNDDDTFRINFSGGTCIDAKRVILASGLGKNMTVFDVPDHDGNPYRTNRQQLMKNIKVDHQDRLQSDGSTMNGDEFSVALDRNPEQFRGKRVIIQGSLVGVDLVEKFKASFPNGEAELVGWLGRDPASMLDGHYLTHAPAALKDGTFKKTPGDVTISPRDPDAEKSGVRVTYAVDSATPTTATNTLLADYYVYALGADPDLSGSPGAILGDLRSELAPLYDINQVASDKPFATVLGLQVPGKDGDHGLTIFGAAATTLAYDRSHPISHTYLDNAKQEILAAAKGIEPGSVADFQKAFNEKDPQSTLRALTQKLADDMKAEEPGLADLALTQRGIDPRSPNAMSDRAMAETLLHTNIERFMLRQTCVNRLTASVGAFDEVHQHFTQAKPPSVAQSLEKLHATQVSSVISSGQMPSFRVAINSFQAMIPPHSVEGRINFSIDNPTQMRIAIMRKHETKSFPGQFNAPPDLPALPVQHFIEQVISLRALTTAEFPKRAADDVLTQMIDPLLKSTQPAVEVDQALENLGIPLTTRDKVSQCRAEGADIQTLAADLRNDLETLFEQGPKPVHGTPDRVRAGYDSWLATLATGQVPAIPLASYWLA
jgi:hypothetical protein